MTLEMVIDLGELEIRPHWAILCNMEVSMDSKLASQRGKNASLGSFDEI